MSSLASSSTSIPFIDVCHNTSSLWIHPFPPPVPVQTIGLQVVLGDSATSVASLRSNDVTFVGSSRSDSAATASSCSDGVVAWPLKTSLSSPRSCSSRERHLSPMELTMCYGKI